MHKTVQERLCAEPTDQPQEVLRFAVALDEDLSKQKNFVGQPAGFRSDKPGGSSEWDDDNIVLHVNGVGVKPFVLKGKINKQQFSTMIGSGSPITIFTEEDVCQVLKQTCELQGRSQKM